MTKIGQRDVISAFRNHSILKLRYPSRHVTAHVYAEDDRFYYYSPRVKNWRTVLLSDFSVWAAVHDSDGWSTRYIKKIWPRDKRVKTAGEWSAIPTKLKIL